MQSSHNIKRVREVLNPPIPDICHLMDTTTLSNPVKVQQKVPKKCVLCAKKGKIGHRLEKSTPTPIVAVVTNLRYGTADLLPAAKFFSLLHFRRALPLPLKFKY